ncbi:hypothetical protein K450DRAFT_282454 [Umbelopsis ramanniana AG]|uniref:Chromatin target of PRMT1 protein C-terminal domain-containing protein n=1 Tax=Umbelopsis ramanniana AG TaxID=1314678 RepID=A0AAD5HCA8_UMBRA|nr:uncharacterized protein K450DRAFT_282454 [Umbelopsis ramanniana AG]KAI8577679.1 hypothetical protein K450DRAFT_282454 [Umbelopsis ramanniana AG]
MGVNRRIAFSNKQNNGRTITHNVGLNERFSQLGKPATGAAKSKPAITNRLGPQNAGRAHVANIQSRLGKAKNAGIKKAPLKRKNNGPTAMEGVERAGNVSARNQKGLANLRKAKPNAANAQKKVARNNTKRPAPNARGKPKAQDKGKPQERAKAKPVSKDDLDKSLDEYMMKDPKTAQARLDDELNQYLADGDLVMDM